MREGSGSVQPAVPLVLMILEGFMLGVWKGKCLFQSGVFLSDCMRRLSKASVSLAELQKQGLQSDQELPWPLPPLPGLSQ